MKFLCGKERDINYLKKWFCEYYWSYIWFWSKPFFTYL